ncbi:MAG: hypothetical protein GY769_07735 [bacterium]|nr:hypothetical protein [bacterium]
MTCDWGSTLVVGIAYDNAAGAPTTVKYGKRELTEIERQANPGTGITVALWKAGYLRHSNSRDIVATWSSEITERAMFATQITEAGAKDVESSAEQDGTTTPATGAAQTTTVADTIHIAAFAANGPTTDTPATANLGHIIGQRIGTAGAPAISNVTLQETYETLTATGNCRATLSLTTARDCCAVIVAFKARQVYTIKKMFQHLGVADHTSDWVNVVVESETSYDTLMVHLDANRFDELTDQEVKDAIASACAWHAQSKDDDLVNPDPDTERDTRMATFIDEQVVL